VDYGEQALAPEDLTTGSRRFLVKQGSASRLNLPDQSVDFVVTDPPYFDSVQYGDLATFFHVWLRQMLPDAAYWELPEANAAVAPNANGNDHYAGVLTDIFRECRRVLRPARGRLVFTYHHWNPKAWAALTTALIAADFALINRYVVHSENPTSLHIANLRALTHDAVLVLAPASAAAGHDWSDPGKADAGDSYQFTHDCATLLGHLLRIRPTPLQIRAAWSRALA
jgi:adenine-specific DNA methylase